MIKDQFEAQRIFTLESSKMMVKRDLRESVNNSDSKSKSTKASASPSATA
jgi:hypothetical protein